MKVLAFTVIHQPEADGAYCVSCPALPGCHSQGDSLDEALANMKEAVKPTIEGIRASGRGLTVLASPSPKGRGGQGVRFFQCG